MKKLLLIFSLIIGCTTPNYKEPPKKPKCESLAGGGTSCKFSFGFGN